MATALDKYADMKPTWDHPVVIESHINGVRSKEMNPNTPITHEEIAEDAIRCWEAGAGAIHAHNTSFDLIGPDAHKDYKRTWDRVLEKHPDITWYPTTCSPLRLLPHEHGLEHVALLNEDTNARVACLDTGLTLFATDVDEEGYLSGPEFGFNYQRIADQVKMLRERDVSMVFGVYEPGHLRHAMHYVNRGLTTPGSMWDFYLIGDYGLTAMEPIATNGMKPSLESLYYYLTMIEEAKVKHPWYISIWGQGAFDDTELLRRAIELGGHIKTGLELFYDPARNPTNLELLQQAQEIAREVGRPIATHDEARALYNLT
ncbi:3-keto-5-aminohexanoate cleavage protein [Kocuria sp. M1R5S2]|uniref:3-keto-5-aminohexanoate cleavage protein n=1 Tax=Kocuria rhizosphaerae TaxID=3376285 RepID=UPI00379EFD0B